MRLILPSEVENRWGELGTTLAPAIQVDPQRTVESVHRELIRGSLAVFEINENEVDVLAVVAIAELEGVKRLSIIYLAGKIDAPYRSWLRNVRGLMRVAISGAKELHCNEIRLQGRDWSRVFPDWERADSELRLEI